MIVIVPIFSNTCMHVAVTLLIRKVVVEECLLSIWKLKNNKSEGSVNV